MSAHLVVVERTGFAGVLNRSWPPAALVRPGVCGVRPGVAGPGGLAREESAAAPGSALEQ